MLLRWSTVVVWALAAASALAWGLKIFVQAPPAPPQTVLADATAAPRGDLARLLGADPPPPAVAAAAAEPAADARFQLVGVVSPRSPQAAREGVALIAVDGKPARAYRVGARVDGDHVLQAVDLRGARLGPPGGASVIALRLPPPAPAATGVLPPAQPGGAMPAAASPVMPGLPPAGTAAPLQPQFGSFGPRLPGSAVPVQDDAGGEELPEQPAPVGGRAATR